ncbi:MAG: diguanylate cyclase [Candidatus Acidiferrales bacterium]
MSAPFLPVEGKKKIFVAEDDPVSLRVLEAFLSKWGYEVTVAANGEEALRALVSDNAPRMAVLDWMMPGMEGVQVCRRLRANPGRPYVYILILTARTQKEDMLAGLDAGADDYLTKPFDARELHARLRVGQRIVDLQDQLIGAREELRFRATHDALTGIYNHGEILDVVRRERFRQERESGSFAIILADLDHFKNVNDSFGHLAGDVVLREAARRIAAAVRPYDFVGRFGGEEFLVVVPAADASGAMATAERVRRTAAAEAVTTAEGDVRFTLSLGVAVSSAAQPRDPRELFSMADEALYRAKELGRNRAELAVPADAARESSSVAPVPAGKSESR